MKDSARPRRKAIAALWIAVACALGPARAQTPGAAAVPFVLPAVPESAGMAGAGKGDTFIVRQWLFEGNKAITTAELEALSAPFLDRPIRGVDVEELRQRITRVYVDRGWVNSGAIVPENAYRDGSLRLTLVEGRVGELRLKGMQGLSDAYVAARLVEPGEALNVNRLQERFQLLLADPLFERLNARLMPGASLGSAAVEVDVTRARSLQLAAFANNHLAPAVGSAIGGLDATLRNLTGWGDALSATLYKSGGSNNADLGWLVPLGARTTTLALRWAHSRSSVIEEPLASSVDIDSVVRSREATLTHPVIDETRRKLSLGLSHGERRNSTSIDGQPYTFVGGAPTGLTRVRAWRFFQDLSLRLDRHVLALRSTFVSGHNNVQRLDELQTDTQAVVPQPDPWYALWVGQAQASLAVGEQGASWLLRASVQRSPQRLVPLEQFSVGGRYTVRGYRENQLVRDNGHVLSAEFHFPLVREEVPRRTLNLVPFADYGSAHNHREASRRLASLGLGLQWTYADLEGDLYVAKRLERRPIDTHGDLQDRGIHLSLRYRLH